MTQMVEEVAFDAPVVAPDGFGGEETSWAEQFTARANFLYLRGGETVQAARLSGVQPIVATIWANNPSAALITTSWRMRDTRTGVTYNIRTIVLTESRAMYELTCESGVAA